ncbi:MAG TPA: hypothetical protein VFI65_24530, partial [Streptosporangiaceae bacterium]|nr:hypothetical protein [Streptosporangiaceae bacterium]
MSAFSRVIAISGLGFMTVASTLIAPGMANAAPTSKPLPCRASMSNARPADYTTIVEIARNPCGVGDWRLTDLRRALMATPRIELYRFAHK